MQIKEFEAYTLKECLQQVRDELGPDAVILETRKFRKGGLLGVGARDAVCIVAATGIEVKEDVAVREAASAHAGVGGRSSGAAARAAGILAYNRRSDTAANDSVNARPASKGGAKADDFASRSQAATIAAARSVYGRQSNGRQSRLDDDEREE